MAADVSKLTEEERIGLGFAKQAFQKKHGMSDEEWEKFIAWPSNLKLMLAGELMRKYRIVAECTESKFCGAGIKAGQKFVFQTVPNLYLPELSDAPPCIKALGPLSEHMHGLWERMFEGLDPNGGMSQYVACSDMGLEYSGIGHVVFKLYCEEIPADESRNN
ncbi:MAG: hypothetical protein LBS24_05470 [Clostridiales Family XIII bacterium]|nr:hypothetical protein [Clostridiales Family XIII bacterium]